MHFIRQWSRMFRSTSADHRCCPRCLITDNLYNLMLLESLTVLANVFIFKTALVRRNTPAAMMLQIPAKSNSRWELSSWPCFWQKYFRNNLHGLTANERKPHSFWFVGFCARAKARYNFHKDSLPAWPRLTICYGLWAHLPPHHLISYCTVGYETFSRFLWMWEAAIKYNCSELSANIISHH